VAKGKAYAEETRAQVMAALLSGQGVEHVAAEYKIPAATVYRWQQQVRTGSQLLASEKRDELGDLIATYLKRSLLTVHVQAEHFADKAWLNKQPAGEAAVLHGVMVDKLVRFLEAAERIEHEQPDVSPDVSDVH
jgi:transposase-like protein